MTGRNVVHLVLDDDQLLALRDAVAYWADCKRQWVAETGVFFHPGSLAAEQVADMVWTQKEVKV
jgi:hypothetical protein